MGLIGGWSERVYSKVNYLLIQDSRIKTPGIASRKFMILDFEAWLSNYY